MFRRPRIKIITGALLILLIAGFFICYQKNQQPEKIKVGLIFSASAPYQLRHGILKHAGSMKNMAVVCINSGYQIYDDEKSWAEPTEKIEQLSDVGVSAVGLIYLNENDMKKSLKLLSDKKIPSFVISADSGEEKVTADYYSYIDTEKAMDVASRFVYGVVRNKSRVAIITDSEKVHKAMALAFSTHYCKMANLNRLDIYAINMENEPDAVSVISDVTGIPGLRELLSAGMMKNAAACVPPDSQKCPNCGGNVSYYPDGSHPCPLCGYPWPATGKVKKGHSINDTMRKIEQSGVEALYAIGDTAPVTAYKHLETKGRKKIKVVATGSELLTLSAVNHGQVLANIEPNWNEMGQKLIAAISDHFSDKSVLKREPVNYIIKDYKYYNENPPLDMPIGRGIQKSCKKEKKSPVF